MIRYLSYFAILMEVRNSVEAGYMVTKLSVSNDSDKDKQHCIKKKCSVA